MSNGRIKHRKGDAGRDSGGFIALPWSVVDCPAYGRLSMHARALLLELARQFVRDNNGRLLLTRDVMEKRGWKSSDMLTKAKRELLDAGFIFETVKGQRPNKASWYAVTWRTLDRHSGYDEGTTETFKRGAYRENTFVKNAPLRPPHGTGGASVAPPNGTEMPPPVPPHGAMGAISAPRSVPPHGHHLEKPSAGIQKTVQANTGRSSCHTDNARALHLQPARNTRFVRGLCIETPTDLWAAVGCRTNWKLADTRNAQIHGLLAP